MRKKLRETLSDKRVLTVIAGFLVLYTVYFLVHSNTEAKYIFHSTLDNYIPFNEWFIFPYISWYLYISVPLVFMCIRNRDAFFQAAIYMFSGIIFAVFIFSFFPNGIAFRPEDPAFWPNTVNPLPDRQNAAMWIVKLLFNNDPPRNVMPSLHCYESVVVCVALFKAKIFKHPILGNFLSVLLAALICLSTVIVKQHSVLDFFAGIGLAVPMYFWAYYMPWPVNRRNKIKTPAAIESPPSAE